MDKWKKAVVHLECATDSEHFYDRMKRIKELNEQLKKGEITREKFDEVLSTKKSRDMRFHGTALFLIHSEKRYLLTARHVVWDEVSANREIEEVKQKGSSWPEHMRPHLSRSATERAQNLIFNIIFRVPSLDEIRTAGTADSSKKSLMNLGAGTPWTVPYTFSTPDLDLAIISLDQTINSGESRFADELQKKGYEPIPSEFILDGPSKEGSDIFTVGFPSSTSLIDQIVQSPASAHWSSSYFSLPVFSFGKVAMMHDELPFYWADMSIFPGNSGGPVVENGKLIGIISAQATLPIDSVPNVRTRIPFGKIIKTKHVRELLQIQAQKDKSLMDR